MPTLSAAGHSDEQSRGGGAGEAAHFRLRSGMASLWVLMLLLPCAALGFAENASIPAASCNHTGKVVPPDTGSPVLRLFYVVTGLCGLISLYFLIRAFRCVCASNQHPVSHQAGGRARDSDIGPPVPDWPAWAAFSGLTGVPTACPTAAAAGSLPGGGMRRALCASPRPVGHAYHLSWGSGGRRMGVKVPERSVKQRPGLRDTDSKKPKPSI